MPIFAAISSDHNMIEIDDTLGSKFLQQKDGVYNEAEITKLKLIAKSFAMCNNSLVVLSNLRTDTSYIYFGRTSDILEFEPAGSYMEIDSAWEQEIFSRVHPNDMKRRDKEELTFFHFVATSHSDTAYDWYMDQTMRMCNKQGHYFPVLHRIHYFKGEGQRGISYIICIYNLTSSVSNVAIMRNSLTGEERVLDVEEKQIITEREKTILEMVGAGLPSKSVADKLGISLNTVNRHRQNIISKLQSINMAEAYHKAKKLGII
jgi:DNA-binding CsgD family transcriptional regulator